MSAASSFSVDRARLRALFRAQATSRHVDLAARRMQAAGRGYYTIGSAGHESNAAVADALRPTDPALLHYRSGAFYIRRAWQYNDALDDNDVLEAAAGAGERIDPAADILAGVAAAADEPIAGGRHKVFGRAELAVIPQTSTIASHLPRAVGVAFAIERARKLGVASPWPADAVTIASFGDASANHSTATGAINAALWCRYSGLPMPLLLVCEDNGLGISVRTPPGWIESAYGHRPGLTYIAADGADPIAVLDAARAAADHVRTTRSPAFLHVTTVRLHGHAGSDVESAYRTPTEIAADEQRDPLAATRRILVNTGAATDAELSADDEQIARHIAEAAEQAMAAAPLTTRAEVMAPLTRHHPAPIAPAEPTSPPATPTDPLTLAQAINRALADEMDQRAEMLVFGEDVARKGGVYGVTRGLHKRFGAGRVFDTLLDEQSILGLALGAAVSGFLPVPEIQYLAYVHNAADQLRGEAATLPFFSQGQYRNPMVVRIAGYGYQRGFGGHFHNDNSVAALTDIPGLVVASPARPDDAAAMLRTCLAAAETDGTASVFIEPIALYHTQDRYDDGDRGWLAAYPAPDEHVPIGRARVYTDHLADGPGDITMVTVGNGVRLALRAARRLKYDAVHCRIVDLRWLHPLPTEDLLREAALTGKVLVVDETRHTGGVGQSVITELVEAGFTGHIDRVAGADSFIPLGPAAELVLVTEDDVIPAARDLASR